MFPIKKSQSFHYILFSTLLFWGCNNRGLLQSQPQGGQLKCLRISYSLPLMDKQGKLLTQAENTLEVFFYEKIRVYQFNTGFDSVVNGKQLKAYKLPSYFVFEKARPFGVLYDDSIKGNIQRYPVADFLKERTFSDINLYSSIEKGDLKLLSYSNQELQGTLDEIYVSKDSSFPGDSLYFSYSARLKNYDYSFSEQLDSLKSSKLYKIRAVIASAYDPELNIKIAAREMNLKLEEIEAPNREVVLLVISKYMAGEK